VIFSIKTVSKRSFDTVRLCVMPQYPLRCVSFILSVESKNIMLSVIRGNVVMLSVVALILNSYVATSDTKIIFNYLINLPCTKGFPCLPSLKNLESLSSFCGEQDRKKPFQ
jgi:hypothetical protein